MAGRFVALLDALTQSWAAVLQDTLLPCLLDMGVIRWMQWEYGVFVCALIEACHASRPELKEYWLAWFLLLGSTLNFFCASESHDQSRCSFVHKNIIELFGNSIQI